MKIIKCLLIFSIIVNCHNAFAQLQNNQWRFGFGSSIDFNTAPPTYPTGAALPSILPPLITGTQIEGSASVADKNTGELLFYTDGVTVWNSQDEPMPNGSNLGGSDVLSSYMAAVIVPFPDSCDKYYIFCIDDYEEGNYGITYSLVDMTLDGGLGDVVAGQKTIPLYDNESELLLAYPNNIGDGYWLISNGADPANPSVAAFEVTEQGVNPIPVLSPVNFNGSGRLNYQGTKFVCTGELDPTGSTFLGFQLYDFNTANGQITSPINIPFSVPGGDVLQYFEFTFDGSFLYAGGNFALFRFDLTSGNPTTIAASATQIPIGNQNDLHGGAQLGPDGNLYYVIGSSVYRIENPENPAASIGPITVLPDEVNSTSLPQWIHLLPGDCITLEEPCATFDLGDTLTVCGDDTLQLQADLSSFPNVTGLSWTGGSGTFIPSNTIAAPRYVPTAAERAQGFVNLSLQVNATSTATGQGGKLIAYNHLGEDLIFYVSPLDGSIDTIQDNAGDDWIATGFESSTSSFYGVSVFNGLGSVNIQSGVETPITFGYQENIFAGEFDNTNGVFYTVGVLPSPLGDPVNQELYSVNTSTGALTVIGNLNLFTNSVLYYGDGDGINGLAYDPQDNVLYGISFNGNLYSINVNDATTTLLGPTQSGCRGLAYDASTQKLWAIASDATLYEIDKNTGSILSTVPCQESFNFITSLTYAPPAIEIQEFTCSDNVYVVLSSDEFLDLGNDTLLCNTPEFTLSQPGLSNYLWQDGSEDAVFSAETTGLYTLQASNEAGCVDTDTISIQFVNVSTTVTATSNGTLLCDTVQLQAFGANTYSWSPSSGLNCDTCSNPLAFPSVNTTYIVTGLDTNGCFNAAEVIVNALGPCGDIVIPNVFSPNGDNINDLFVIKNLEAFKNVSLIIFNRWGRLIYQSDDYQNTWDGGNATDGTYFYVLFIPTASVKDYKGTITIMSK
jgi:gliding motility-associated-like protein